MMIKKALETLGTLMRHLQLRQKSKKTRRVIRMRMTSVTLEISTKHQQRQKMSLRKSYSKKKTRTEEKMMISVTSVILMKLQPNHKHLQKKTRKAMIKVTMTLAILATLRKLNNNLS